MDLSGAEITDLYLRGAYLYDADLKNVTFTRCHLRWADFDGADCRKAKFDETSLKNANFTRADLREADFEGSDLEGTVFKDCELSGANFAHADIVLTVFLGVDLSETCGLDTAVQAAYSYIGIDTIYASKGQIPESFLLGCGVPENFITQIPSLIGAESGIQFHSCFISYSSKDTEFAKRLYGKMREVGRRVWFAPEDMEGGKKLHEQIETAIRLHDKLLIVLSEASLRSDWVATELRKAFKSERKEGRRKLFPLRLVDMETIREWECFDADSGKDLASELREYFIPDFSQWKDHDSFESAFNRLNQDLRY